MIFYFFFFFLFSLFYLFFFFFSSRRRHTRSYGDWSSDVCSSDLAAATTSTRGNLPQRAPRRRARRNRGRLESLARTGCATPMPPTPSSAAHPSTGDRKSTRLNSSHRTISYAVFCLKKKNKKITHT